MSHIEYSLRNDEVHIWNIDVDFDANKVLPYENILSTDEKKRANRFKFESDRIVYETARVVLRLLSSKYLKTNPEEIQFNYNEFGKPFFKDDTSLRFNVSHSGERIALAFCHNHEIGVDIEKIKNDFDVMELAQNFFSKTEIASLQKQPREELSRAFFRCWTRKEAFIKAEGSGLSFPLNKFAVSLDDDNHARLLETDWDASEKAHWSLFSFVPKNNYISAVAVRKKNLDVKQFNWTGIN